MGGSVAIDIHAAPHSISRVAVDLAVLYGEPA